MWTHVIAATHKLYLYLFMDTVLANKYLYFRPIIF